MSYLSDYLNTCEKAFVSICDVFKKSFEQTEKDLGREMTLDEKKVSICFGIFYLLCDENDKKSIKGNIAQIRKMYKEGKI